MKNVDLSSFAGADALAHAAASAWLDEIDTANRAGRRHCVALSGGRIAQKFFAATVELAGVRSISFAPVHFFWADERCVAPADPESNFRMAKEFLLAPLEIPAEQIHRLHGEDTPDTAVKLADEEIRRIVSNSTPATPARSPLGRGEGAKLLPVLDLIVLGMGEDGHVASLFPNAPFHILDTADPFLAIPNSPKPPARRISLSYAAIAAATQVWTLVSGAGKLAALRASLRPDGDTPLARVMRSRAQCRILCDIRLD